MFREKLFSSSFLSIELYIKWNVNIAQISSYREVILPFESPICASQKQFSPMSVKFGQMLEKYKNYIK